MKIIKSTISVDAAQLVEQGGTLFLELTVRWPGPLCATYQMRDCPHIFISNDPAGGAEFIETTTIQLTDYPGYTCVLRELKCLAGLPYKRDAVCTFRIRAIFVRSDNPPVTWDILN